MVAYSSYTVGGVLLGAAVLFLVKFVSFFKSWLKKCDLYRKFPQTPSTFLFGHLFEYPGPDERGLAFQREIVRKFPRSNLGWMMQLPLLFVSHPDTIKIILKTAEPKGERIYNMMRPWVGDGLLTSKGKKWSRNRRLLTPAFHFNILKDYIEIKNRCADLLLRKFEQAATKSQPIPVFANITMFTLDVILRCAMSYETDCQTIGESHPYVQAVNRLSEILVDRFFKPWLHSDWIFCLTPSYWQFKRNCEYVHKVAEEIITRRKEVIQQERHAEVSKNEKSHRCLDFLDILLTAQDDAGLGLTSREIREEVDTFLFEGHDTTASAISWSLYSIAEHQDVQKRVQQEIDRVMAGRETDDLRWEDLSELPYLTMVIKECLRIHSPVPFIQRELTVDTEIDGNIAPAGTLVNLVIYNIHHNPEVWGDTMVFDPDRFLPENIEKRSAYAFVPFSAGPRNCIGQNFAMHEIKIALARILYRFNLRLDPDVKVEKAESVVMRAQRDISLLVSHRRQSK